MNNTAVLRVYANGRHGFYILDDNGRSREIIRATIEFLKQYLIVAR